jgi:hypothetical protein
MKEAINRYYQQILSVLQRAWRKVKDYEYRQLLAAVAGVMDILPGLIAWLLEVLALTVSVICVITAGRQAYQLEFYSAIILITLSALLVGLAILSDYYTRPTDVQHGGGG